MCNVHLITATTKATSSLWHADRWDQKQKEEVASFEAELFRHAFNKGKVLNNDDQTLVTKIYMSHHLTKQEALDAVKPRTSRGRPKSTGGTAKSSSKPRAASSNASLMSPASRKQQLVVRIEELCNKIGLDVYKVRNEDVERFCQLNTRAITQNYVDDEVSSAGDLWGIGRVSKAYLRSSLR